MSAIDPNQKFGEGKNPKDKWEPRWGCISFGTYLCEENCEFCDAPKDEIELLCEAKW